MNGLSGDATHVFHLWNSAAGGSGISIVLDIIKSRKKVFNEETNKYNKVRFISVEKLKDKNFQQKHFMLEIVSLNSKVDYSNNHMKMLVSIKESWIMKYFDINNKYLKLLEDVREKDNSVVDLRIIQLYFEEMQFSLVFMNK